jgi:hypothetical protein
MVELQPHECKCGKLSERAAVTRSERVVLCSAGVRRAARGAAASTCTTPRMHGECMAHSLHLCPSLHSS